MPQMAPLSWTLLFMVFTSIYMFVSTKVYFLTTPLKTTKPLEESKIKKDSMNWKW